MATSLKKRGFSLKRSEGAIAADLISEVKNPIFGRRASATTREIPPEFRYSRPQSSDDLRGDALTRRSSSGSMARKSIPPLSDKRKSSESMLHKSVDSSPTSNPESPAPLSPLSSSLDEASILSPTSRDSSLGSIISSDGDSAPEDVQPRGDFTPVTQEMRVKRSSHRRSTSLEITRSRSLSNAQVKVTSEPIKVCLMGMDVGKSSLACRFFKGIFYQESDATVEDDYNMKLTVDGLEFELNLIDCGATFYSIYSQKWISWADGFILAYSVTDKSSFNALQKIHTDILEHRNHKLTPIILCGTKLDEAEKREVMEEDVRKMALHYRCKHIETSAKTSVNVDIAIRSIAADIVHHRMFTMSEGNLDGLKSGWLKKRKKGVGVWGGWKRRYMVLTKTGIRYYEKKPAHLNDITSIRGLIPLKNLEIIQMDAVASGTIRKKSGTFNWGATQGGLLTLKTFQGDIYEIRPVSDEERMEWYEAIKKQVDEAQEEEEVFHRKRQENDGDRPEEKRKDFTKLSAKEIQTTAIKKFNAKPKSGIQFLKEARQEISEEDIAIFLESEGLSKTKIGEYLGELENIAVLERFLRRANFEHMTFDTALRNFLTKFRLPGEAQKN
eukprot:TRINITY_DN3831_c0_g1_i1.p1 TRINITY_DN3831_c0_g1~~TRINITY_DN3831_c0_g1_i1.p1  ORF type:complete len:612 (+),score=153.17 TRINITY_DN3831_c0_g1_i1:152-1987(+)